MRWRRIAGAMAVVALFLSAATSTAKPPTVWRPVPDERFEPVVVSAPAATIVDDDPSDRERAAPAPDLTPAPTPEPTKKPKPTPKPTAKPKVAAVQPAPRTSSSAKGKASWYCSPGQPVCHFAYPPGSMVAAACGKLRTAMGPDWRGRLVTVAASNGNRVTVKLVDWCGSTDKLIDLYWEPMRQLGGTGVLAVTVRW